MATSFDEIKQLVESGGYTPQSRLNRFEQIKRDVKSGKYDFGVDENYINSYLNDSVGYVNKLMESAKNVSYDAVNSRYDSDKSDRYDLLNRNKRIQSYLNSHKDSLPQETYEQLNSQLDTFRRALDADTKNLERLHTAAYRMERENYNAYAFSKYVDAGYDAVKSAAESATNEDDRKALENLKYSARYKRREDYEKAISDIDAELEQRRAELERKKRSRGELSGDPRDVGKPVEDDPEIPLLLTRKSMLEKASRITEFTEMPSALGEHNMGVFMQNLPKYIHNPTGDELKKAFEQYDAIPKDNYEERTEFYNNNIPKVEDPLGFFLENKDLMGQYNPSSSIAKYLGNTYDEATDKHWDQINDEEKTVYYYTLHRQGKEKAMEYLELLRPTLGQRYLQHCADAIGQVFDEHGSWTYLLLNAASIPMNRISGIVAAVDDAADYVRTGDINPYSSGNQFRMVGNAIRSETAQDIAEALPFEVFGKNIAAEAYKILMSTADSVAGAALFGGAYTVVMSIEAGADAAEDIYSRGGTAEEVLLGGAAMGVAEAFFEKFSVERLLSGGEAAKGGVKDYLKSMLTQFAVEGSEEMATEIADQIIDKMLMGERSAYALRVDELVNSEGLDTADAAKKAFAEDVFEVICSGLAGGIAGAGSSAIYGGVNLAIAHNTERSYKAIGSGIKDIGVAGDVIQYGIAIDNSTAMKAFKSGSGEIAYDKISDRQLGKIYSEIRDGFLKEMRVAENTGDLERIVNRQKAGVDSEFINSTIVAAALQVMNEDQKKFRIDSSTESGQSGNTGIDSGTESGYNGERGESYADNDQRRLGENAEEDSGIDRRGEEEAGRAWRESKENDLRGAQEGQDGGRPQERIHVKQGSRDIYYKPGRADGSVGSSAVDILNDAGIDAVLCDGDIIAGSGRAYSQALTMPDGTVYVSNNATLPALEIAAHEAVHSYEVRGSEYYAEYEAVISDNLLWGGNPYDEIANHLNDEHYSGKYDIDSIDFAKLFIREISAYVNQYVTADIQYANERFSGIFSDWQSVVEASRQFNKNIGADFSGSAFFAPESGAYESVFERLSGADGEADSHKRSNSEFFGTKVLTDEQKAVESVGKVLGVGVVFKNLDTSIKKADGKRELFRPNGYYDKNTNTIYINSSRSFEGDALMTVFKHELTHFTENASGPYDAFCDAAKRSKEFRAWLEGKTKRASDKNADGKRSVDQMMAKLNSDIRELYSRRGIDIGVAGAQREIYADFAGDVLFARNGSAAENIINSLSIKQRPRFIEAIRDFLKFLREKLKGNRDITFGILMLETRYKNAALRAAEVAEVRSDREGGKSIGNSDKLFSINRNFADEYDGWDKKDPLYHFKIGRTSKVLQKLGINEQDIVWDSSKIIKIKSKHPEMTDSVIKQVPGILEDPIIVMRSKTTPGRMTMFGEVYSNNGKPILAVLELHPTKGNVELDEIKIASAYGKDNAQNFINSSEIIYIDSDKKRTDDWSRITRLQLPIIPDNTGSLDITVSQSEQSVNSSISKKAENDTENRKFSVSEEQKTDYGEALDELLQKYESGEIDRDTYKQKVDELFKSAGEEYGTIRKGENVGENGSNYEDPVPRKTDNSSRKVKQYVRTVLEGGHLTDEMVTETKAKILSGEFSYIPTSNIENISFAENEILHHRAEGKWEAAIRGDGIPSAKDIAIGEALAKLAIDRKDAARAIELMAEISESVTRAGQAVQASSLIKRMDGMGQLYYVQKSVDRLNRDLMKKYGNRRNIPQVEIDEDLALQLANSKTADDFAISYAAIMQNIGDQVPSTFLDKWNAWRYLAMLANPTTHVRNLVGNAVFVPAVKIKDVLAAVGERAFLKKDKKDQRTKSIIVKEEYKRFAENDFKEVKDIISGNGKWNPKRDIDNYRTIFKKAKPLEWLRQKNGDMLEAEDLIFLKYHYKRALGGFLQARKADLGNVGQELLVKARKYAIEEAQKATYRDACKVANYLKNRSNQSILLDFMIEGVLPFKKTPINIMKRGIEYSPIGFVTTLFDFVGDIRRGEKNVAKLIDGLAAGLTGTGIFLTGVLLTHLGVIRPGFDDDKKNLFKRLLGMQQYSVEIGDISYTIDWSAPVCIPFFMGSEFQAAWEKEDNNTAVDTLLGALNAGLGPIVELSMLSGIRDTISSARYANETEALQAIMSSALSSYFTQGLPTIGGKIANIADGTRRSNYIDRSSDMPVFIQSAVNTVKSKVPFLSMTRPEYINSRGETEHTGFVERSIENLISPGYFSKAESTEIDNELMRLSDSTGSQAVFPTNAPKKLSFKKQIKYLSSEEYKKYATERGRSAAGYIREFIECREYKDMSDEDRVEVIQKLYKFADAKAKASLSYSYDELNAMHDGVITEEMFGEYSESTKKAVASEYFLSSFKKAAAYERNGGSAVEYYINWVKKK